MADEHELRRVNWTEVFGFTQLFKSFHVAMHISKLALAVMALTLLLCFGFALDVFWSIGNGKVQPQEIAWYVGKSGEDFDKSVREWKQGRLSKAGDLLASARHDQNTFDNFPVTSPYISDVYRERVQAYRNDHKAAPDRIASDILKEAKDKGTSWNKLLSEAQSAFCDETAAIAANLKGLAKSAEDKVNKNPSLTGEEKAQALQQLTRDEKAAWLSLSALKIAFDRKVTDIRGEDISTALREYELACLENALSSVRYGNIFGGMDRYQAMGQAADKQLMESALAPQALAAATQGGDNPGFVFWVLLAVQGIGWLICHHYIYAVLFLAFTLAIWAVFGGAIYRIAALQAARGEKISISQALKFSIGKFGSFATAPLLPLAIVLGIGLLIAVLSIPTNIPWLGEIILGLLFILCLLGGLAIAFLLVGLVAGGALMYPTIAVEGSDSFDAISRSFTYVISRPWRAGFYALIALVYGTITYLFVRLFVYIALASTHVFLKWGVWAGGKTVGSDADKIDVLWTAPTFSNLWGTHNWQAMSGTESIGAFMLGIWVFLLAACVGAYVISFFASSSTIIYLLLRQKVDATDLDDVYIDEPEEFLPTPTPTPASETPEVAQAPAEEPAPAPASPTSAVEPTTQEPPTDPTAN
jgi:hypothetical protein